MSWSCTSSYFRNLLSPYIFRSVKLRNDQKSGESVTALLKGPFGALVKELYFIGTVPNKDGEDEPSQLAEGFDKGSNDSKEEEEGYSDISLPSVVSTILSDLRQFPNLDFLSMGFTYPYAANPFDEYYALEDIVDENENPEVGRAWRALMATTYETLFRNKEPLFKGFEIRRLVWTNVEPFESATFHELLGHIERFTLSVRGGDNGAGWHVNTLDGYLACVSKFDELFFNHLHSATTMTLKAPEEGPIGLEGMNHEKLALKDDQMPRLRELHLEYCFIGQELANFLKGHDDTLETLTLRNCASSVNGLQENPKFYWKDFFAVLDGAPRTALTKLEILPLSLPLPSDELYGREKVKEEDEPVEVQQTIRVLREDSKKRLFAYATLDDKYGMTFQDDEENLEAFQRGEDQAAYDRVMERVKRNAKMGQERNPISDEIRTTKA